MSAILVARFAALMTCFWLMDGWELDRRAGGGLYDKASGTELASIDLPALAPSGHR